ncbi:5568_t:CDS:2, partial [Entrophospora sp. SA101]
HGIVSKLELAWQENRCVVFSGVFDEICFTKWSLIEEGFMWFISGEADLAKLSTKSLYLLPECDLILWKIIFNDNDFFMWWIEDII